MLLATTSARVPQHGCGTASMILRHSRAFLGPAKGPSSRGLATRIAGRRQVSIIRADCLSHAKGIPDRTYKRLYDDGMQKRSIAGTCVLQANDKDKESAEEAVANAPFPILTTVADFRAWRRSKMLLGQTVGFVPTMGALHEGHLSLVRQSIKQTDCTVVSIFVNPAQFAPTEDLDSYPRTLPDDIAKLVALQQEQEQQQKEKEKQREHEKQQRQELQQQQEQELQQQQEQHQKQQEQHQQQQQPQKKLNQQQHEERKQLQQQHKQKRQQLQQQQKLEQRWQAGKGMAAIFAPTVAEMYPSPDGKPFTQHVAEQQGAFVEVHGLQAQMEGASRPIFFRGVATVCTKLFHVVQPDLAFFGQKDIQQAIILKRLVSDLLFSHPPSARALRVIPTARDEVDGLALSSRNTYLTPASRRHAAALYRALRAGEEVYDFQARAANAAERVHATLQAARQSLLESAQKAQADDVSIDLLYISLNHPITLADLEVEANKEEQQLDTSKGAILSGAVVIRQGKDGRATRLIDNLLLGFRLE